MNAILGINAALPTVGISGAITPTLLASELSISTQSIFSGASSFVELSGMGQLLSATANFQDQLRSLKPGTANSSGGMNYGTDLASLAAETQSFVDTYNKLQNSIANANNTSSLLGRSITGAAALAQSLSTLAQASYTNAGSNLTNLAQLGILYQPDFTGGTGGSLSINLNTLKAAYNSDATGAFALLAKAANAYADLANNFVGQAQNQYTSLSALAQTSSVIGAISSNSSNNFLSQALTDTSYNPTSILYSELTSGKISLQQAVLAINEYSFVSNLLA